MKNLCLFALLVLCVASQGCIFDPNEAHQTPAGYYQWGFDAYTFWYNPNPDVSFSLNYMGKGFQLDPYEIAVGSPETRTVIFKIWEYDYDYEENLSRVYLGEKESTERIKKPIGVLIGDFQKYQVNLVQIGKAPDEEELLKASASGERPITLSVSGGPRVDSERVYYPRGTQLKIDMYRGGCWFEPIYWTLE